MKVHIPIFTLLRRFINLRRIVCVVSLFVLYPHVSSADTTNYAAEFAGMKKHLSEGLSAGDENSIEAFNDCFYWLDSQGASVRERAEVLNMVLKLNYDERRTLQLSYLFRHFPIESAEDLILLKSALQSGLLFQLPTQSRMIISDIERISDCSPKTDSLKLSILNTLSSQRPTDASCRVTALTTALNIGLANKDIDDKVLGETFGPLSQPPFYEMKKLHFDLPGMMRKIASDATPQRKHVFVAEVFLDELLMKYSLDDVVSTWETIASRMRLIGADKLYVADSHSRLGFALMLANHPDLAMSNLLRASGCYDDLPAFSEIRILTKLARVECSRRLGKLRDATAGLRDIEQHEEVVEFPWLNIRLETLKALVLEQEGKTREAMNFLLETEKWYSGHPDGMSTTYTYNFVQKLLPGEIETLNTIAKIHVSWGEYAEARKTREETERLKQFLKKCDEDEENQRQTRERNEQSEISDVSKPSIRTADVDVNECKKIVDSIQGRRLPEHLRSRKIELLNYGHLLASQRQFEDAEKIALLVLNLNDRSAVETGALLAYCFAETKHDSLSDFEFQQAFERSTFLWNLPEDAALLMCRNQAYLSYYKLLAGAQKQNHLRTRRYFADLEFWISQPSLAGSPLALSLKNSAQNRVSLEK